MLKFYSNKELSKAFGVNLAKWKRWSREFLPPDPLGGLQSGYARQYNPDDAFKVFMGGYLVADLKFTIPESKNILQDLHAWMVDHGFYFGISESDGGISNDNTPAKRIIVHIFPQKYHCFEKSLFFYKITGIVSEKPIQHETQAGAETIHLEWMINKPDTGADLNKWLGCRTINMSALRSNFLERLHSTKLNECKP